MTGDPVLRADEMLEVLAAHDVCFVVIGGFSLAAHGVVRGTKDIDIVPDPDPGNLRRLSTALRDLDAALMLADDSDPRELGIEPDEEGLALGGNWVLRTRLGRLDVMQDIPGVRGFEQLLDGSVEFEVPECGRFRFAGFDDLVAMKVAAGRPQDEFDVASLYRARGG
jgi:hypothetical protein